MDVNVGMGERVHKQLSMIRGVGSETKNVYGPGVSVGVSGEAASDAFHYGIQARGFMLNGTLLEGQFLTTGDWAPLKTVPVQPTFGFLAGVAMDNECVNDECLTFGLVLGAEAGVVGHLANLCEWRMVLEMSLRTGTVPDVTGMPVLWLGVRM